MGGIVSGITDAVSSVGDIASGALKGVASNPIGAGMALATGNYNQLLGSALGGAMGGGGGLASSYMPSGGGGYSAQPIYINNAPAQQQPSMFSQLLPFLMQAGGGVAQQQVNKEAAQAQADTLRKAGQQAAQASQFRPVGTTTRFGSSNFQVDPTTGRLISAGYTATPLAQSYQKALAGMTGQGLMQGQQIQSLAGQYLGESPEAVRRRVMQQRMDLLAPSRERELAKILNTNYQTGTSGLSVGATGLRPGGGEGLRAANPRLEAYYNALAQSDLQSALEADKAAQQQVTFGTQLAGQAYDPFKAGFGAQGAVEQAAQQPMKMSTDLASQFQDANQRGAYYNLNAQNAAANAMLRANQVSPFADIMTALGKTPTATTAIGGAIGGALGGLFGGTPTAQASSNPYGFDASALNFGGWTGGGTSVYNPDAFSLSGDYGGSGGWDTSNINGFW